MTDGTHWRERRLRLINYGVCGLGINGGTCVSRGNLQTLQLPTHP